MSRKGMAWLAVAAALMALGLLATVRKIPEGQVGIVRDGASVRLLQPGVHMVNPIRDRTRPTCASRRAGIRWSRLRIRRFRSRPWPTRPMYPYGL